MSSLHYKRSFFPKLDASVLQSAPASPPTSRPKEISPIYDHDSVNTALKPWNCQTTESMYPASTELWVPAPIPTKPQGTTESYLAPVLTRNERLRLTLLSYYTRDALEDNELMSLLQEKIKMAKETVGWEFIVMGLVTSGTFIRVVTHGLPLAILPRRESLCAHTINQKPGSVFVLTDMGKDWRFSGAPQVKHAGLRAYAGVPLIFGTHSGDHVAIGTIFVASSKAQEPLSKQQQMSLIRLADWIVTDIIYSARIRREQDRRHMQTLLGQVQDRSGQDEDNMEDVVMSVLQERYPKATVKIHVQEEEQIQLEDGVSFSISDLDQGLWEDEEHIDRLILESNHQDMVASRAVRIVAAKCENASRPSFLLVGSADCTLIFDDISAWFVSSCAALLCRYWQSCALKVALATKETFLRGITHQLRTPIHGILGTVELLTEDLHSQDTDYSTSGLSLENLQKRQHNLRKLVDTIRTSAQCLISTVNDLISLSRCAEMTGTELTFELHHIKAIELSLKHNIAQVMPDSISERPSVIFTHQFPQNCDALVLDLGLFVSSIVPIIKNAIQHTTSGTVAVTITIPEKFGFLMVDVQDSGEGIDESLHKSIFDGQDKNKENRSRPGLGLTLASRLAAMMRGSISLVSSQPGKGAHFAAQYRDTRCACTPKPIGSAQKISRLLQSGFYMPETRSEEPSIDRIFRDFLIRSGYKSSDTECSLYILPFGSSSEHVNDQIARVKPTQAGVCLTSESAFLSKFDYGSVRRDKNVVFVKSPFTTSILEEALSYADEILREMDLAKMSSETQSQVSGANQKTTRRSVDMTAEDIPTHSENQLALAQKPNPKSEKTTPSLKVSPPIFRTSSLYESHQPMALLVDDNDINLRLLQMFCDRRGIPYRVAKDGEEAVRLFKKHGSIPRAPQGFNGLEQQSLDSKYRPKRVKMDGLMANLPFDFILMDLQMPNCDGIDATYRIRAIEREYGWPRTPLCIISGQDSHTDRFDAEEAGACGYMVKPVGPKLLDVWIKDRFPQYQREAKRGVQWKAQS